MRLTVLGETCRPSFQQLTSDSAIAPAWILAREAQDELSHPIVHWRTA
jgi:hypothetical protein